MDSCCVCVCVCVCVSSPLGVVFTTRHVSTCSSTELLFLLSSRPCRWQIQRQTAAAGRCFRLNCEDARPIYWASAPASPPDRRPTSVVLGRVSVCFRWDCDKKFSGIRPPASSAAAERRSAAMFWHEYTAEHFTEIIIREAVDEL